MYKVYQIEPGDTLNSIADKVGVSTDVITELNGPMNFSVGEYIIIPNNQNAYFRTYRVQRGDSLYSIARKYGIPVDELSLINGLSKNEYIYPNQELLIPNEDIDIYITKMGDTIDTIMENFNTDYQTIKMQNSLIYLLPEQLIVNKKK